MYHLIVGQSRIRLGEILDSSIRCEEADCHRYHGLIVYIVPIMIITFVIIKKRKEKANLVFVFRGKIISEVFSFIL